MPDDEIKNPTNKFLEQTAITVIAGFSMSVFLILIGLIVLVRFWAFENFLYNVFFASFLIVGIIFNIASVNLTLHEYAESSHILPFIYGTPITLFWTVLCIVMGIIRNDFFIEFGRTPLAVYYREFYDGLGFDPNNSTVHPFVKPYISENSFYGNTPLLVLLSVFFSVIQLAFWLYAITFHHKVAQEEKELAKIETESPKEL